jgi:hypothetical protein
MASHRDQVKLERLQHCILTRGDLFSLDSGVSQGARYAEMKRVVKFLNIVCVDFELSNSDFLPL